MIEIRYKVKTYVNEIFPSFKMWKLALQNIHIFFEILQFEPCY